MKTIHDKVITDSGAIVVVVDPQGKAEYISPSVTEVLGYEPTSLLGNGWFDRTGVNSNERELMLAALSGVTSGSAVTDPYERLLKTAWGGHKWILWKTSRDADGKLTGIGYDITERKAQEQQLVKRTKALEERTHEIEASLRYAKRIQNTILPNEKIFDHYFRSSFVFYKPKDIVSGDWWWVHETVDSLYVAVIDCTGHGVPGALLSVLAHSIFKEVFINTDLTAPCEILHAIDEELMHSFRNENGEDQTLDGMDVSLIRFMKNYRSVEFAGAGRPLFIKRSDELLEIKGDVKSIGFSGGTEKWFTDHYIDLRKGDTMYLFSDGFTDQFGGQANKKLGTKGFRELIHHMEGMDAKEQGAFLSYSLQNWKQDTEQTDDITVIGLQF